MESNSTPEWIEKAPLELETVQRPQAVLIDATAQTQPVSRDTSKAISIDELSKWTAVILVFVYVSGFLITSLNDFRYGFTEMNPLRPRILAAGGWFTLFLAIPIALTKELMKHQVWKEQTSKWYKLGILSVAYYTSANLIYLANTFFFAYDETSTSAPPTVKIHGFWKILGVIGIIVCALVLIGVIVRLARKLPKPILGVVLLLWVGIILGPSTYSLFFLHSFQSGATVFWMFAAGLLCFYEMRQRSWTMKVGDWPTSTVLLLGILTIFATFYYPHIMTKWGGGASLPIRMTLTKDSPIGAGRTVRCSLIDETDAGFFVIGQNQKHATFVPRSEVAIVDFTNGNDQSLFDNSAK